MERSVDELADKYKSKAHINHKNKTQSIGPDKNLERYESGTKPTKKAVKGRSPEIRLDHDSVSDQKYNESRRCNPLVFERSLSTISYVKRGDMFNKSTTDMKSVMGLGDEQIEVFFQQPPKRMKAAPKSGNHQYFSLTTAAASNNTSIYKEIL